MSQRDRHSACRRRLCNTPPKMAATTPGPSLWQGPRSAHRTRSCVGSPAPSEPSCSKNAHNYQSSGLDPGQEHPQKLQIAGASPRDSGGTSAQRLASHMRRSPPHAGVAPPRGPSRQPQKPGAGAPRPPAVPYPGACCHPLAPEPRAPSSSITHDQALQESSRSSPSSTKRQYLKPCSDPLAATVAATAPGAKHGIADTELLAVGQASRPLASAAARARNYRGAWRGCSSRAQTRPPTPQTRTMPSV